MDRNDSRSVNIRPIGNMIHASSSTGLTLTLHSYMIYVNEMLLLAIYQATKILGEKKLQRLSRFTTVNKHSYCLPKCIIIMILIVMMMYEFVLTNQSIGINHI